MTGAGGSRLWPVIGVLATLLFGAAALELYARTRDPRAIVVQVRAQAWTHLGEEDRDGDASDEATADPAQPVSSEHAQARELARRGQLQAARELLERALEQHPEQAVLNAELGYWLLVAGETDAAIARLRRAGELDGSAPYTCLNLGVGLRRAGDLAGAEAALVKALALKPGFRAARLALATVLRKQQRNGEAIALLEQLARTGGNAARAEALLALGKALLAAGRTHDATRAFEQAIEWLPSQAELRISIARAYLAGNAREDVPRALAVASVAVALAPSLAQAHSTLARARELAGDADGAQQAYANAIRLQPDYHHARRRLLRLALDRRDFAEARAHAERLLARAPAEPEHHFLAGLVDARAGQLAEARAHYVAAIEAALGDYPEAHFNLGLLEKSAGRLDAAIAAYEQAIQRKPDYLAALNNLGLAYAARGDDTRALSFYGKALAVDARYVPAWSNLGKLHLRRQAYPAAVAAFERAAAVRPGAREPLLNLGVAYRKAGRLDDATATYRKLVAAQPRYVSAWYNLGVALEHGARAQDAQAAYRRALALDPEHAPSLKRSAGLLVSQGRLTQARDLYQSVLDLAPGDRSARIALADVYRREGNTPGCEQAVIAALAGSSQDATLLRARCRSPQESQSLQL